MPHPFYIVIATFRVGYIWRRALQTCFTRNLLQHHISQPVTSAPSSLGHVLSHASLRRLLLTHTISRHQHLDRAYLEMCPTTSVYIGTFLNHPKYNIFVSRSSRKLTSSSKVSWSDCIYQFFFSTFIHKPRRGIMDALCINQEELGHTFFHLDLVFFC